MVAEVAHSTASYATQRQPLSDPRQTLPALLSYELRLTNSRLFDSCCPFRRRQSVAPTNTKASRHSALPIHCDCRKLLRVRVLVDLLLGLVANADTSAP